MHEHVAFDIGISSLTLILKADANMVVQILANGRQVNNTADADR
jgi:predicted N-formylglutamate amidohydrolase